MIPIPSNLRLLLLIAIGLAIVTRQRGAITRDFFAFELPRRRRALNRRLAGRKHGTAP